MRNIINLLENVEDPILMAINIAAERFGRNALYGGNCGMFALALARYLKTHDINTRFIIICDDVFDYDADISPQDIIAADIRVYHVALGHKNNIYDGDGLVTRNQIADWVEQEYGDDEPAVYNFAIDESGVETLIENETDWTIAAATFEASWR